jgi:DNA-binding MarR family transcriptional regulator
VAKEVSTGDYRALAELRNCIRQFVREGDAVARSANIEPQHYLVLLAIRGLPAGQKPTIRALAECMALQHHSMVELINRMARQGYVRRDRGHDDRRVVTVSLLPAGERILAKVARQRLGELRSNGHELVRALNQLLKRPRRVTAMPPRAAVRTGQANGRATRGKRA